MRNRYGPLLKRGRDLNSKLKRNLEFQTPKIMEEALKLECTNCHIIKFTQFEFVMEESNTICTACREGKYFGGKSFLDNFSKLKEEWDYETNYDTNIIPSMLTKSRKDRVAWVCRKDPSHPHFWTTLLSERTQGSSCPVCVGQRLCWDSCNSLFYANSGLEDEWDEEKNGSMTLYFPKSNKYVSWICKYGHKWEALLSNRMKPEGRGCPVCTNKKIADDKSNSLYCTHPHLRDEWDEKKNGDMKEYFAGNHKLVSWICRVDNTHQWLASIVNRTNRKSGCPMCSGHQLFPDRSNSVYYTRPHLREFWNEEKNGDMKEYHTFSNIKVWWICKNHKFCVHEWEASVTNRSNGMGCPYCSHALVCEIGCNSVYYTQPMLRDQWDEEMNGVSNEELKKYFMTTFIEFNWICKQFPDNPHRWKQPLANRVAYIHSCPICNRSALQRTACNTLSKLQISFQEEKRFPDCKRENVEFPYDLVLNKNNKEIRVELQGQQHFYMVSYYHPSIEKFKKRLEIDQIKAQSCFKSKCSFLSISYFCLGHIEEIFTEYLRDVAKCDNLYRFYVTKSLFLELSVIGNEVKSYELKDEKLYDRKQMVYQIYKTQLDSILCNSIISIPLSACGICDDVCITECMDIHYRSQKHNNNMKKLTEMLREEYPTILSVTHDGNPMILRN